MNRDMVSRLPDGAADDIGIATSLKTMFLTESIVEDAALTWLGELS